MFIALVKFYFTHLATCIFHYLLENHMAERRSDFPSRLHRFLAWSILKHPQVKKKKKELMVTA
ncbi:hypothetical protein TU80_19565 [Pseudomonas veronii]|nr:hypothetical protein TU80_19565 [Pseudomonas veronii]